MRLISAILLFMFIACTNSKTEASNSIDLLANNNLDQWDFVLQDSTLAMNDIWTLENGVLYCSGAVKGYIYTKNDYSDYKLSFDWRYPEEPGNSGVLLHIVAPDSVWPACIQAQLKAENAGDFIMMLGTTIKEQLNKAQEIVPKLHDNIEKNIGEWNSYEIICKGDNIDVYINGTLQNRASQASVSKGKIGLQSEGKPIEFRNMILEKL